MSGHSKWSTIKHKKAREDARRGKVFSKIIKEITVSARTGGGDVDANPRLRLAVQRAKDANMPGDNIDRAIKKGTGELPGTSYEDASYEGYGPGGIAILVEVTTDNRNRTVSEVRHIFTKYGGSLGESGCVAWQFERRGLVVIPTSATDEETLLELALEGGAQDVKTDEDSFEVISAVADFETVRSAIEDAGLEIEAAEITMIPKTVVKLDGEDAGQLLRLMEALEDQDDVQGVYANFDIPEEVMAEMEQD